MHELGHTLGLQHGGGDGVKYKPNYHSVMNYTWQMPEDGYETGWRLDYSRQRFFPINKNSVNSVSCG